MAQLRVQVKDLRVGDVLPATGQTITHAPYQAVRLPSNKRYVGVQRVDGPPVRSTWGAYTLITVERAS